jgi:hypothetical protein
MVWKRVFMPFEEIISWVIAGYQRKLFFYMELRIFKAD